MDQMIRTRNFRARNERNETAVSVKSYQGKNVSVERRMGECKIVLSCSEGTHRLTKESLRKECLPEAVVLQEKSKMVQRSPPRHTTHSHTTTTTNPVDAAVRLASPQTCHAGCQHEHSRVDAETVVRWCTRHSFL